MNSHKKLIRHNRRISKSIDKGLYIVVCAWALFALTNCSSSRTNSLAPAKKSSSSIAMKGSGTLNSKKLGEQSANTQRKTTSPHRTSSLVFTPLHHTIIAESESWIGVPYSYGGATRLGVDCSALIMNIYNALGIPIPRTATEQFQFGTEITREEMLPGDLVFFNTTGSPASHVGIVSGADEFIHASSSIGVTKQKITDSYFVARWSGARRIISLPQTKPKRKIGINQDDVTWQENQGEE
jgi:murein DD-endopeptidase / murein LD-carboxypeptidase